MRCNVMWIIQPWKKLSAIVKFDQMHLVKIVIKIEKSWNFQNSCELLWDLELYQKRTNYFRGEAWSTKEGLVRRRRGWAPGRSLQDGEEIFKIT